MSVHVSSWVWKHSKAKDHQLLVLLALADMANDEGKCWPSIKTICQRCRISERSARGAVSQASKNGELQILAQEGPNWVNVYRFTAFITPAESAPPFAEGASRGAKSAPLPPAKSAPLGAKLSMQTPAESAPKTSEEEPSKETTTTTPRTQAKAIALVAEEKQDVVVVASLEASEEAEPPITAEELAELEEAFGLNGSQKEKVRGYAESRGVDHVRDKADLTRLKAEKNAAKFFLDAQEGDWKRPVKLSKKKNLGPSCIGGNDNHPPMTAEEAYFAERAVRKAERLKGQQPEAQAQQPPMPPAPDYSAEKALWRDASDEQRQAWLKDEFLRRLAPKDGEEPRPLFLCHLRTLTQPQTQEAAA
jgi:hypothetical protein